MIVARNFQKEFQDVRNFALDTLVSRNDWVKINVILADIADLPASTPRIEFRGLSTRFIDPMPFCVYGDKLAIIISAETDSMKVVVVQSAVTALLSRKQFCSMWEKAMPSRTRCQ